MAGLNALPGLLLALVIAVAAPSARAQQDAPPSRVALVIGNAGYPGAAAVADAVKEARAVAATLREGGFDVVTAENAGKAALEQAIAAFAGKLRRGGQAVVFYAGHAVQLRDRNFLLPVDTGDPASDAVDLDLVVDPLIVSRPSAAVMLLDAARDNPWQARLSPSVRGLRPLERLETVAVVLPVAPGRTAPDSGPRASPAVEEWLKAIATPGLDMTDALARTREAVSRRTRREQQLWLSAEPPRGLVVTPQPRPQAVAQNNRAVIPPPAPGSMAAQPDAYELAFWDSIRTSESATEYRAYLDAYPQGRFAALARAREQLYSRPGTQAPARPQGNIASAAPPPPAPPAQPAPPPAAAAAPAPAASPATIRDCQDCPELTAIPAGSFQMGATEFYEFEKPVHPVTIRPFYLGTREVTFEEWDACVAQGGCSHSPGDRGLGRGSRPVTDIHWNDAQAYLTWLSAKTGRRYRFPTEAEWEYAARAGAATAYPWGAAVDRDRANCVGCGERSRRQTLPTGQFPPNAFGLYDMAGNAAEWVADCWTENYRSARADGAVQNAPGCRERVLRGGSFNNDPRYLRSAARFKYDADVRFYANGFRVARDP